MVSSRNALYGVNFSRQLACSRGQCCKRGRSAAFEVGNTYWWLNRQPKSTLICSPKSQEPIGQAVYRAKGSWE